ncbi:hypothetical protein WJX77_006885 [Trebouxia sp. C0004]
MGENMDNKVELPQLARQDLHFWLDNIDDSDGKSWLKRDAFLHVVGDASKVGYGAYMPNAELAEPMVMTFNPNEMQLMAANKLSSVFREVKNVRLAVQTLVHHLGDNVVGKVIVYIGDFLSHATFMSVCLSKLGSGAVWGFPTLDVFAGGAEQQHCVSRSRVAKFAQQERDASALDREYMEAFDLDEESAESESDHGDQGDDDRRDDE